MDPISAMSQQNIPKPKPATKRTKIRTDFDPLSLIITETNIPKKPSKDKKPPKPSNETPLIPPSQQQNSNTIVKGNSNTLNDIQNPTTPTPLTKSNDQLDHNTKIASVKGDFFSDKELIAKNCGLMKSETIKDVVQASYKNPEKSFIGVLVLTDFRLIFKFKDENLEKKFNINEDYFKIPLFHILKVEKVQDKKVSLDSYPIEINLKDTRTLRFHLWEKSPSKYYPLLIEAYSPRKPEELLSFSLVYMTHLINSDKNYINGWKIYEPKKEYIRQGVTDNNDLGLRFSEANKEFKLCATYPRLIVEPSDMTDEELKEASDYRTKNRLPVMSYYYNGNKQNDKLLPSGKKPCPCIWRSSQNKGGVIGTSRSNMDEKLLGCIMSLCSKLYIYDARPYLNAFANRFNGGGFENKKHYTSDPNSLDVEIFFCSIENIHSARSSLNKLYQLCLSDKIMDNQKFWSALENTGWYQFIHLILKYSNEVSKTLQNNYSVLIHCSDGWDRSAQLISLSQVLIDPYFRTIEGLAILIEKDWLSFGHQFGMRNGFYLRQPSEDQRSPIFLQWLDCLHQLLYQFPNAFEFNEELLLFLAKNYTTNLYGTFMFNSEQERVQRDAQAKTTSVWSDVMKNVSKYKNIFYDKDKSVRILSPNYAPYKLRFWREFFTENNIDLENSKFYLSDSDYETMFNNNRMYFEYNKKSDIMRYMNMQLKSENLMNVLYDVYVKVKKKPELMDKISERTKVYLEQFVKKGMFKEIEKQKLGEEDKNDNAEKV